jgi:outer membrane protein OmpA-like peptidoglycan-associated protein
MPPPRPMLDDLELVQAQRIASAEEEVFAEHAIPALEGDFLQDLGRRAVRIEASAVLSGPEAKDRVEDLREKFRVAEPMPFTADIATATRVDPVLVESLAIRERAGRPDAFEVAIALREFIAPPIPETENPPIIPPDPPVEEIGSLQVTVLVEGRPEFDFSTVTVTATGTRDTGETLDRPMTGRSGNVWTEDGFPPGQYTINAVVESPEPMSGAAPADVRPGQVTEVVITLRPGAQIAKAFIIHYRFDRAFVEPCLREVLSRAVDYSNAHPNERMLVVGHTDRAGSGDYNQFLSERRARGVYAFLAFGRERDLAITDWNELRKPAVGASSLADSWGTREQQYMLQDLGFYVGNIDEQPSPELTAATVRFQTDRAIPATGTMNDATWLALVTAYMEQDAFAIPEERLFRNADGSGDAGPLRWLGCGEQVPVRNTEDAWRPNRRTEILFVRAEKIPCQVPKPVTLDLPPVSPTLGPPPRPWRLGPGNPNQRQCFATRDPNERGKWLIQPAEPGKVRVEGQIVFEDGSPVPNAQFALAAADGEYLHTNEAGEADLGEVPRTTAFSPDHPTQAGRPIPDRADADGKFSYPKETPEGVYILELFGLSRPEVARAGDDAPEEARGNVVCLHFEPGGGAVVVR